MIYAHSLERGARFFPNRTALVSGDGRSTFRELHERVTDTAACLRAHGFGFGDRLAILLPNEPEYIELIYACSMLGVIAVPLNTRLTPAEIDRVLVDASPRGLIRHPTMPVPSVRLPWERVLDKEPLAPSSDAAFDPIYNPDAVLALVYTSGTTGHPKGVALTHANVLANVHFLNYWMPYEEGGVYLHAAPMFHIVDFPLFAAPAFGTCQVTIPKFSAETFCETVQRERVTHTILVPTMINLLTQFPQLRQHDLSSLRRMGYGGSPMPAPLIRRVREVLPNVKLVQGYGLSETGFLTGLLDHEHTEDRLLSCGRSCPGIDVRIVDQSGRPVVPGQHGELVARGANVMRGYWNNPEETARALLVRESSPAPDHAGVPSRPPADSFFRTGDIGYQNADGYFYILDRAKDMIVTGGENVYCGEVEAVLYQHPAIREAAVFGIPDPQWGELVTACVVLKPGQTLTAEELIAHCRRSLAGYKIPRRIEFMPAELPKNGSGKVLKRLLRERYWSGQGRSVS